MHDKAEFECEEDYFAFWEAEIVVIPGGNPGKQANLAAEKAFCAYNFDFFAFLYAFSCKKRDFGRFRAGKDGHGPHGKSGRCGVVWRWFRGMSADFVRTVFYPAGWVADKTAGREGAAGERPNEDLGAQGGPPPSLQKIPLN